MKITSDISITTARHRPAGPSAPWYTPWNSPVSGTAPGLVLAFSDGAYGAGGNSDTLAGIVNFSRPSDATRTDPGGALQVLGPNTARIDHDPVSFAPIGLLLEEARSNLFVQSGAPADQTVSVAAVSHAISFYGTGSVTLSGAHVAVVSGGGAYPVRTELAFTPTAGNLTLTLSGDVTSPQLEEGSVASSYIPTLAAAATRDNDVATVGIGPWFDTTQGTLVFEGSLESASTNDRIVEIDSGAASTRLSILWNNVLGKPQFQVWQAGALQAAIAPPGNSVSLGNPFRVAITFAANDFGISLNGGALATDVSGVMPSGLTTLRLGRSSGGAQGLMMAEGVTYYPTRLSDAEVQALSA